MADVWPSCVITPWKRLVWRSAAIAFALAYAVAFVLLVIRLPVNMTPGAYYAALIVTSIGPALSVALCWLAATLLLKNTAWQVGAIAGIAGFGLSFLITGAVVYGFGNGWFTVQSWMGLTSETRPRWRIAVQSMSSMMFWAQLFGPLILGRLVAVWFVAAVSIGALASKLATSKH